MEDFKCSKNFGRGKTTAAIQLSYNGEEVTTQAGVDIVNLGGSFNTAGAASEGFDEALTMAQVLTIVDPFIV